MKRIKSVLLAMTCLLLVAAPAKADGYFWTGSGPFTGGSNFATTASASLWYSNVMAGVGFSYMDLVIDITNEGDGEVFKAIGLINFPSALTATGTGAEIWDGSDFQSVAWTNPPPMDLTGDGLPGDTWALIAPNPAPANGLMKDERGRFYFRLSGTSMAAFEDLNIGVGVHAISGPADCSTKLGILAGEPGGVIQNQNLDEYEVCVPVPEPTTGLLVATGLLGLFGVSFRRRKGNGFVEE